MTYVRLTNTLIDRNMIGYYIWIVTAITINDIIVNNVINFIICLFIIESNLLIDRWEMIYFRDYLFLLFFIYLSFVISNIYIILLLLYTNLYCYLQIVIII
jgi:hypothetical protein